MQVSPAIHFWFARSASNCRPSRLATIRAREWLYSSRPMKLRQLIAAHALGSVAVNLSLTKSLQSQANAMAPENRAGSRKKKPTV
jgi:hypothetical protein